MLLAAFGLLCFFSKDQVSSVAATVQREPIYEGKSGDKEIAFAMNVDWGTEYIPDILAILAEEDVKITFFFTGRWCGENPEVAKSIYESGMEIGNHGLKHKSPNAMSYEENLADIKEAEGIINDVLAIKTTLFAPASGEIGEAVLSAAADLGYTTILWSVDTIDWQKPAPDVILTRVRDKMKDGTIVLMHPTENTVEALQSIIEAAKEKGYTVVPVSKVIN